MSASNRSQHNMNIRQVTNILVLTNLCMAHSLKIIYTMKKNVCNSLNKET